MKKMLIVSLVLVLFSCNSVKRNYDLHSSINSLYPIELVYFDEKTEAQLGSFPIKRSFYADLIENIEQDEPKYVILKFMFDSDSVEDSKLLQTLLKYDNVLTETTTSISPDKENPENTIQSISLGMNKSLFEYQDVLLPNETLRVGFSGVGLADVIVADGEFKDYPLLKNVRGYAIPSLALLIAQKEFPGIVKIEDQRIVLNDNILEIENGNFRIDLSEPKRLYPTYSMIDVLKKPSEFDFRNKIVIIFIDNYAVRNYKSEYDGLHNGAEIIADSINTVLKRLAN